jgi:hypothetical protein
MPTPKSEEWYFSGAADENHGPVSFHDLQRAAADGKVLPSTLVWKDGMDDWVDAKAVKGLFTQPAVAAPEIPLPKHLDNALRSVQVEKLTSVLSSPGFYRNAAHVFGFAAVVVFLLSSAGYPFGLSWFSGGVSFLMQFLLLHGIASILVDLQRLKAPPTSSSTPPL